MATNGQADTPNRALSDEGSVGMPESKEREQAGGEPTSASDLLSNNLAANDPHNPQNWPLHRKVLVSSQAWFASLAVAIGITAWAAGTVGFVTEYGPAKGLPEDVIAGFSLTFFGIAFAPIFTPHVTERIGRSPFYALSLAGSALLHLAAGYTRHMNGILTCRFFAGLFGGPVLILVEGTFADMWSAEYTNTYYAVLGCSQFMGAGLGILIGSYIETGTHNNWRWTEWFSALVGLGGFVYALPMRETYQREIPRRLARFNGKTRAQVIEEQGPAPTGATIGAMIKVAVVDPLMMFLTVPVVTMVTYTLFFTWALTFQFFYAVQVAFTTKPPAGPGFTLNEAGLVFLVAIVGSAVGATLNILMNVAMIPTLRKRISSDPQAAFGAVEYRILPAIPGTIFMFASLFWVANTISPEYKAVVPISGAGVFLVGASMTTFCMIPYLYDTFSPTGVISALTSQAVGRVLAAGFLPLVVLVSITNLKGPKYGLGVYAFFGIPTLFFPFIIFFFGAKMRRRSKYALSSA